ncbi:MAG: thioredoxin-disulfide reductase [Candidatus Nanoarchaeia archaeon]
MKLYDVIIIGAGPAGLTAAIYARRRAMKTLVISKDLGGQIAKAISVENYPGFEAISGYELMQKFFAQAQKFSAEIIFEEVNSIDKKGKNFSVKTSSGEYFGKTVILAYGKTPRSLDVPGEKAFVGKGVSYCATCDAPLFRNKIVAVVGGGNSAFDTALYTSKIAKQVYLIHRRAEFRADEILIEKAKKTKNIQFMLNSIIKEIKGNEFVSSIVVENVNSKQIKDIAVNGVFVEIGYEVKTDIVAHLVKLDEYGQIVVDNNCATSHPGVFAAGDITNIPVKQAIVSAGEGAKAALAAYNWLHGTAPVIVTDWAKK